VEACSTISAFRGWSLFWRSALIVFGPAKLPQLGRAFGDTLREFRNSTKGLADDRTEDDKDAV